jgi:hypothetical protein
MSEKKVDYSKADEIVDITIAQLTEKYGHELTINEWLYIINMIRDKMFIMLLQSILVNNHRNSEDV